jgi:hypothetical protein
MLEICMSGSMRGSGFIPAPYSTGFVALLCFVSSWLIGLATKTRKLEKDKKPRKHENAF